MLRRSRPGGFQDGLHAVESKVHLGGGSSGTLPLAGIAAQHPGNEQPVVSKNAGRSGFVRLEIWRIHGFPSRQIAHRNRIDLHAGHGKLRHTQDRPGRRNLHLAWQMLLKELYPSLHTC